LGEQRNGRKRKHYGQGVKAIGPKFNSALERLGKGKVNDLETFPETKKKKKGEPQ